MKYNKKILKTPIGSVVHIRWNDPSAVFGWTVDNEVKVANCVSVAILTDINKTGVCIATTVELNSSVSHGALSLPWEAIHKFEAFEQVTNTNEQGN